MRKECCHGLTRWNDEVRVQPGSVAVDHEVREDVGIEGLLAQTVVVAGGAYTLM